VANISAGVIQCFSAGVFPFRRQLSCPGVRFLQMSRVTDTHDLCCGGQLLQQMTMQRVASRAASRAAASFSRHASQARHSSSSTSQLPAGTTLSSRQLSQRLKALTEVVVTPQGDNDGCCMSDVETGEVLLKLCFFNSCFGF
jgi:hypothetical protein